MISALEKELDRQYYEKLTAWKDGKDEGHVEGRLEGQAEGLAQGRAEGLAQGLVQGQAQGESKALLKVATDGLSRGMSVEAIADLTGLTTEEVANLR
jgi:flagellar biosynthesis/type III secretory pathway protein FliH